MCRSCTTARASSRRYEACALLRGARPGTGAYELRKQAVLRAKELQRSIYGLPRAMSAYTNAAKGYVELAVNLDNPFYGKPEKLVPIVAHEQRHIEDASRALRLEAILEQRRPDGARRQKLQAQVDRLWSRPRAEARAFEAQAFALGIGGKPLGMWWRAPQGDAMDQAYPPDALNRSLVNG